MADIRSVGEEFAELIRRAAELRDTIHERLTVVVQENSEEIYRRTEGIDGLAGVEVAFGELVVRLSNMEGIDHKRLGWAIDHMQVALGFLRSAVSELP